MNQQMGEPVIEIALAVACPKGRADRAVARAGGRADPTGRGSDRADAGPRERERGAARRERDVAREADVAAEDVEQFVPAALARPEGERGAGAQAQGQGPCRGASAAAPEPDPHARRPGRGMPALPAVHLYDRIEIPEIKPDVTQVRLQGGTCPCCAKRF